MSFEDLAKSLSDYLLILSCILILTGSVILTFKLRFVQMRLMSSVFGMLKSSFSKSKQEEGAHTILPHKALFTAMSTTLGIGTIVAPIIAINLGGPGALIGFLLTSFFGSAATYAEVTLCIAHRARTASGQIMGGPMQYIKRLVSPMAANFYAIFGFLLMIAWSGAQSNQLAAILDSPMLGDFRIAKEMTGLFMAAFVMILLIGGIKWISALSSKLVPLMFVIYLGSNFWILGMNFDKLGAIFAEIFNAALEPKQLASGTLVGGIFSALRWGIFKGLHANEAGIGTQTIPHSMAETENADAQGTVAMLSTITAGLVGFISGCVALVTRTFEDASLPLGVNMVAASFQIYFAEAGIAIVSIAVLLFAFGTILGNSYNGSQCYNFLTNNRLKRGYFVGTALIVFCGAIAEVKIFWAFTDVILALMTLINMTALMLYAFKNKSVLALTD